MGGVERGELEGGDGAGVQVEGCDGGSWGVGIKVGVYVVFCFFWFYGGRGVGGRRGLGGVEDSEVAEFVAGEDEGFFGGGVEGEGIDTLGDDFNP